MNETRMARAGGIAGIAGIVLLFIANAQLGTTPKSEDSAQSVLTFLTD